jgi:hypothetical protein
MCDASNSTSLLQQYQYKPRPTSRSIRYLILLPGSSGEPLHCTLHTTTFNDKGQETPSYEALSYVWGNPTKTANIVCDGQSLQITPNLHQVLVHVRNPAAPRTLWADSICIDQENMSERETQVLLMGRIYAQAKCVLIWLGCDTEGDGLAAAAFLQDSIAHIIKRSLRSGPLYAFPMFGSSRAPYDDERWASFAMMRESAWFRRVWVVQEAGLAADATIIYGESEMSWVDLNQFERWISSDSERFGEDYGLVPNPLHQQSVWGEREGSGPVKSEFLDLLTLLDHSRYLQAADPRDHIYAFLASPAAKKAQVGRGFQIMPDYQNDYLHVYYKFTIQYLQTMGYRILTYVEHDAESFHAEFPPSWVPLWNRGGNQPRLLQNVLEDFGRHTQSFFKTPMIVSEGVLWLQLNYIGRVEMRSEKLSKPDWEAPGGNQIIELWKRLCRRDTRQDVPIQKCKNTTDVERLFSLTDTLACKEIIISDDEWADRAAYALRLCPHAQVDNADLDMLTRFATNGDVEVFDQTSSKMFVDRRFIACQDSEHEFYGLAPELVEEGDTIWLSPLQYYFVLRRSVNGPHKYRMVGPAFGTLACQCDYKGELRDIILH